MYYDKNKVIEIAKSQVDVHSAALFNERGQFIKYECFEHGQEE